MSECSLFSKDRPAVHKSLPPPLVLKYLIYNFSITNLPQEYLQSTSRGIQRKLNSWNTPKPTVQILTEYLKKVICGNKMPTRSNRGSYCRPYCLLNMFQAPLCPSSELNSVIHLLLPVVFRPVVFKLLVWCGAEGNVSGLQNACWLQ